MSGETIFAGERKHAPVPVPDPEDIRPEVVGTEENEKPEPNHDISQKIIEDIMEGDEADQRHQEEVKAAIYRRDHPRTIH